MKGGNTDSARRKYIAHPSHSAGTPTRPDKSSATFQTFSSITTSTLSFTPQRPFILSYTVNSADDSSPNFGTPRTPAAKGFAILLPEQQHAAMLVHSGLPRSGALGLLRRSPRLACSGRVVET